MYIFISYCILFYIIYVLMIDFDKLIKVIDIKVLDLNL